MYFRLVIIGTGVFATELVKAVPAAAKNVGAFRLAVTIVARCSFKAEWLAVCGRAISDSINANVTFGFESIDFESRSELESKLAKLAPDLLVVAASLQSMGTIDKASRWGDLVARCGYGVTAPLQAVLLRRIQRAIQQTCQSTQIVNACYPDILNAWSSTAGYEVLMGLGNVGLLSEVIRQRLNLPNERDLFVFAGHWHVAAAMHPASERRFLPGVWLSGIPVSAETLRNVGTLVSDQQLSHLGGYLNARLLLALSCRSRVFDTHAPGVKRRLGGRPISIRNGTVELRTFNGIEKDEFERSLLSGIEVDGVADVSDGKLHFSSPVAHQLRSVLGDVDGGIDFDDVEDMASTIKALS